MESHSRSFRHCSITDRRTRTQRAPYRSWRTDCITAYAYDLETLRSRITS